MDRTSPKKYRSRLRKFVERFRNDNRVKTADGFRNSSPFSSPTLAPKRPRLPGFSPDCGSPESSPTTWPQRTSPSSAATSRFYPPTNRRLPTPSDATTPQTGKVGSTPAAGSPKVAPLTSRELIAKVLTAFQKGDGSFNVDDFDLWLKENLSIRKAPTGVSPKKHTRVAWIDPNEEEWEEWRRYREAEADSDEEKDEVGMSLWHALEQNRKVVEEEKAKFLRIFDKGLASVREEDEFCEASGSRGHPPSSHRRRQISQSKRPDELLGSAQGKKSADMSRKMNRILKLHRHRSKENDKYEAAHDQMWELNRSKSCPALLKTAKLAVVTTPLARSMIASPDCSLRKPAKPNLMLELPARGIDFDMSQFGYTYVDFLAQGSIGTLHLVRRPSEDKLWVAKVVDLSTFPRGEATQALLEAELLRRLKHPNIVEYLSSFLTQTQLIIVMEFCPGGDLHGYLNTLKRRGDHVEERRVYTWTLDIARGLQHMHKQHVLHCDVKSSNIFLDAEMNAKIGDLGIARELRRGSSTLSPMRCPRGTPLYMSPEMCRRAALTTRSDCWSLGCILFELCHLKHAFSSQLKIGCNENQSVVSSKSSQSSRSTAFLPGITGRSDMSFICKSMLTNIHSDLRRLKHKGSRNEILTEKPLPFWSQSNGDDQTFYLPRVLPTLYGPLLNYLVCAALEPKPADRPSLDQIIEILEQALTS